jgi:tetratricopeptide (TPR) repeat protein
VLSLWGLVLWAALAVPRPAPALEPVDRLDDVELPALAGGRVHLLGKGQINVLVFVRAGQAHSLETLKDLASREGQRPEVRWVAILSGDTALQEARALVSAAGVKMPVVLDVGDVLYAKLLVKLHPTVFVLDRDGRVAATEPFRAINYGDRLAARIRFTLGEISQAELAEADDPKAAETHSDEGVARSRARYAQKLLEAGMLEQALAEVQKSLTIAPTGVGYVLQGKILARQGKCADASRAFEVALRLEPKNGEAAAEQGRCTGEKGRAP